MTRRTFSPHGCACGSMILSGTATAAAAATAESNPQTQPANDVPLEPVNPQQIMAVLKEIDGTGDKTLIDAVFTRWGTQCFHARPGLIEFANAQRADFQAYVDHVNTGVTKFWEKLDYDPQAGIVKVIARKFGKCVCGYGQCPQPPKSLCTHCCKQFQVELFKALTGRNVTVEITQSILLGGERCTTTVRLHEPLTKPE